MIPGIVKCPPLGGTESSFLTTPKLRITASEQLFWYLEDVSDSKLRKVDIMPFIIRVGLVFLHM